MRTSIILALVAASFTAVLATSSVPNNAGQVHSRLIKKIKTTLLQKYALPIVHGQTELIRDLIDLNDALIGLDNPAIEAQLVVTLQKFDRILNEASAKFNTVVDDMDAQVQVVEQLKAVIAKAFARASEIIMPLLDALRPIVGGSKANGPPSGSRLDTLRKLGVTIAELTTLVKNTVTQLEDLLVETICDIVGVLAMNMLKFMQGAMRVAWNYCGSLSPTIWSKLYQRVQ